MAEETTETNSELQAVHTQFLADFDRDWEGVKEERQQSLEDRRFYSIAGAQWEGELGDFFVNRPKVEVNKIHLSVMRIINEYRNNRITVDFINTGDDEKLAQACDGLYRADELDSNGQEAYSNAFEECAGGGMGAWRYRAAYEDEYNEDDDYQRVRIEPIADADQTVFFDIDSIRADKSDSARCTLLLAKTKEAYEEEYGSVADLNISECNYDWYTTDKVYIAEYFKVEEYEETVYFYKSPMGAEQKVYEPDHDEEKQAELTALGFTLDRDRKVKRRRVHKYVMDGARVLEDCGVIAGKYIPVIPCYGKRWIVEGVERFMGHVRLAKDSQRLKNMMASLLAEYTAKSQPTKPIFTPEEIEGHEDGWANDAVDNNAYMLKNAITDKDGNEVKAPTENTQPQQLPPALVALASTLDVDINDLLGNQQGGEQMMSNVSGNAVEMIQNRLDMQSFIYMDNFAQAMKWGGTVWLSIAKDLYIEDGRVMKTVTGDNSVGKVELNRPVMGSNGTEYENDLTTAKLDIVAGVGASSSSKRQATVRAITGMMQMTADPTDLSVLSATAIMNMDGEGIEDIQDYYRQKLLRMGVVKPTEEEEQQLAEEQANQQPDANTVYLESEARKNDSTARKTDAETLNTLAKTEETEAKTFETLAGIDRNDLDIAMKASQMIDQSQQQNTATVQPSPVGENERV